MEEEIEAAYNGEYLCLFPRGGRMGACIPLVEIPELEMLIDDGETISSIAKQLGVTYRTVCRWRAGKNPPNGDIRQASRKV